MTTVAATSGRDATLVKADGIGSDVATAHSWHVTCSGLADPTRAKLALHRRHGMANAVRYARVDVLGLQHRAVRNLHRAVRPGGELWVLENGASTRVHRLARRRLAGGRSGWRYLSPDELDVLLAPFASRERASFGVAGAGGRTERQRALVARLDRLVLEPLTPSTWHYVLAAVATKQAAA